MEGRRGEGEGRERVGRGEGGRGGVVAATSSCARVAICAISHCQPLVSSYCSPEGTSNQFERKTTGGGGGGVCVGWREGYPSAACVVTAKRV